MPKPERSSRFRELRKRIYSTEEELFQKVLENLAIIQTEIERQIAQLKENREVPQNFSFSLQIPKNLLSRVRNSFVYQPKVYYEKNKDLRKGQPARTGHSITSYDTRIGVRGDSITLDVNSPFAEATYALGAENSSDSRLSLELNNFDSALFYSHMRERLLRNYTLVQDREIYRSTLIELQHITHQIIKELQRNASHVETGIERLESIEQSLVEIFKQGLNNPQDNETSIRAFENRFGNFDQMNRYIINANNAFLKIGTLPLRQELKDSVIVSTRVFNSLPLDEVLIDLIRYERGIESLGERIQDVDVTQSFFIHSDKMLISFNINPDTQIPQNVAVFYRDRFDLFRGGILNITLDPNGHITEINGIEQKVSSTYFRELGAPILEPVLLQIEAYLKAIAENPESPRLETMHPERKALFHIKQNPQTQKYRFFLTTAGKEEIKNMITKLKKNKSARGMLLSIEELEMFLAEIEKQQNQENLQQDVHLKGDGELPGDQLDIISSSKKSLRELLEP